jgi:putative MATE family efflux protein
MQDFTRGNILKQLLSFSFPIIVSEFLLTLNIIIDAAWVGRLLGPKALAAVSVSVPLVFIVFSIILGLRIAANILTGQMFGRKDKAAVYEVLFNSLLLVCCISIVVSLVSALFSKQLLLLTKTPPDILQDAHAYVVVILAGLLPRGILEWYSGALKGLGDAKTPLCLLAFSVVLNFILAPLCIVGIGPLPAMGIAGAAVATVISPLIAIAISYPFLIKANHFMDFRNWRWRINIATMKKLSGLGVPAFAYVMTKGLSWATLTALVNQFGSSVTATYGIGVRIDMLAFLAAFAISQAVTSMVAQNTGAYAIERIHEILHKATKLSVALGFFFFILVNLFPGQLASIFTRDPAIIHHTIAYLRITSWGYLLMAFSFSLQGVINGSGNTKFLMLASFLSMVLVRIVLAYFLSGLPFLKERGIWLSIIISAFVSLWLCWYYYAKGKWMKKIPLSEEYVEAINTELIE